MDKYFALTIVILCSLWYAVGSSCSVLNKVFLQQYTYPVTLSMISLLSISIYSIPLTKRINSADCRISLAYRLRFLLPISVGKAAAVTFSSLSLWKVPVSYAHTVKATMPLFAVLTARVILGERQHFRVYLSLVPIVFGVMIATATEISFNLWGLLSALASTFTYSIINTIAKRVYRDTNMHPMILLRDTAQLAALMLFPFWCITDGISLYADIADTVPVNPPTRAPLSLKFLILLAASGALSFLQNLFAFTLIRKLTALSYAVANTTKRVTVISVSLLTLHNPVTPLNLFGMACAILGVFGYNRAKISVDAEKAAANQRRVTAESADDDLSAKMSVKTQHPDESDDDGSRTDLIPRVITHATLSDASFLTTYPGLVSPMEHDLPAAGGRVTPNGILMDSSRISSRSSSRGGSPYRRILVDDSAVSNLTEDSLIAANESRRKVKFLGVSDTALHHV